jgi:hypothetical protein
MKRIIYIGDFRASFSTENYIAWAFQELGYDVTCIQEGSLYIGSVESMVSEVKAIDPDFVLFSKGRPRGNTEAFIEHLKKHGIKTCVWLFDLYFDLPGDRKYKLLRKEAPFNCEYIVSTDGGHEKEFADAGIKHRTVRQGIYEKEAILYERPKDINVLFVGGDYFKNRKTLFDSLKAWYGKGFVLIGNTPDNQVRGLALNELYASSKVVVGDSQPSPRYWSNRIYETLGRGGFLIHPYVEGLEEEFEIGKHLVTFPRGDFAKLKELIDYYLEHDEEREQIRKAGFEHIKKHYTYKERCKELINILHE